MDEEEIFMVAVALVGALVGCVLAAIVMLIVLN